MYPVSDAWKTAIKNKAEQRIMLVYPDCILLRENISMDGGVEYTEILNADTDLNMGKAVMAGFNCRIVNNGEIPETCFTDEFTPMIGVCTEQTFHAGLYDSYLSFTHTIDGNEETITVISENGTATVQKSTSDDAFVFETNNAFTRIAYISGVLYLKDAFSISMFLDPGYGDNTWEYKGRAEDTLVLNRLRYYFSVVSAVYVESGKSLEYIKTNDGFLGKRFDFIPLGKFTPERPQKIKSKYVDMQAYDRMNRFEGDASTYLQELNLYDNPKTAGEIFVEICNLCGVGYVSSTFRHDWITLRFDTFRDKEVTFRQVLAWIAECGGNSVRINRDGLVEMVSFAEQEHVISKGQQFEAVVSERITPVIDKLEVYTSYTDILTESGSGNNLYQIIDNPFLYAENDGEVDGVTSDIYGWLGNFPAHYPATVRAEADPAVQCGDIIRFMDAGMEKILPVFALTLTWNGYAKAVYESTGQPKRSNLPTEQRMLANLKKEFLRKADAGAEIESYVNSAEGKASILTTVFGEYTGENPIEDYVTKSDVKAEVTTQVNAMDFTGIISSVISGEYVTESELNSELSSYATKTQVSNSITQSVNSVKNELTGKIEDVESEISLETAVFGDGTLASNVKALLTLFANKDSSSIRLAANAITLTATESSSSSPSASGTATVTTSGFASYGFVKVDEYYVSNNYNVHSSIAIAKINLSGTKQWTLTLDCISYGESNFDYGIIYKIDTTPSFSWSNSVNIDDIYKSFEGLSSPNVQTVTINIPSGSHYIYVAYRKDGSGTQNDDSFKFKIASTSGGSVTSSETVLSLTSGGITLSSAKITFSGAVTFEDLSTPGKTTIHGSNIITGTITADALNVKTVYFNGNDNYTILRSEDSGTIIIGSEEVFSSTSTPVTIIITSEAEFQYPDETSLFISTRTSEILPAYAESWNIGATDLWFKYVYTKNITLTETTRNRASIYLSGGELYVEMDGTSAGIYKIIME